MDDAGSSIQSGAHAWTHSALADIEQVAAVLDHWDRSAAAGFERLPGRTDGARVMTLLSSYLRPDRRRAERTCHNQHTRNMHISEVRGGGLPGPLACKPAVTTKDLVLRFDPVDAPVCPAAGTCRRGTTGSASANSLAEHRAAARAWQPWVRGHGAPGRCSQAS